MELIAIQKNIMINPDMIESVEKRKEKFVVTMESGREHFVDSNISGFLKVLSKSGVDLSKQFISV